MNVSFNLLAVTGGIYYWKVRTCTYMWSIIGQLKSVIILPH